jgi:hypothetical protein
MEVALLEEPAVIQWTRCHECLDILDFSLRLAAFSNIDLPAFRIVIVKKFGFTEQVSVLTVTFIWIAHTTIF